MKPDDRFVGRDKAFWACVRSLSQHIGYTVRRKDLIKVPTIEEMRTAFVDLNLTPGAICGDDGRPTKLAQELTSYFQYRADILNENAARLLMDYDEARRAFDAMFGKLGPNRPILPRNKQKGDKAGHALLTGMVNMLIWQHSHGAECDYDPRELTTVTRGRVPLRTLARRVDGAFPSPVNPVAIWEIKEYYHTTTFGSRIADGVYETLLDGVELEELRENCGVDIKHYLFIDSRRTWWAMGKAYLCRIVDMLNMGYVDEVLLGKEIFERVPELVAEWLALAGTSQGRGAADPSSPA